MLVLGPIGFTAPWLLLGLLALPVLWWLLRAVPPAPIRRAFPGVTLLLGLEDSDTQTDRTPWWLLLLRMLAIAAVILGFAGPVLNPQVREAGSGPLVVFIDDGWAAASDWRARLEAGGAALADAGQAGRTATVVRAASVPVGADLGLRAGNRRYEAEIPFAFCFRQHDHPALLTVSRPRHRAVAGTLRGER